MTKVTKSYGDAQDIYIVGLFLFLFFNSSFKDPIIINPHPLCLWDKDTIIVS